jgi:hypothetical protein
METDAATFDRRQIDRAILERLNPASAGNLVVPPEHDPRDPDQPPIHVSFACIQKANPDHVGVEHF